MEQSLIKNTKFIENVQSVYFITKINKRRLLYSHEKFTALKVWYSFCNFSPILFILLLLTFYFLFCIHFNISWNVTGKKIIAMVLLIDWFKSYLKTSTLNLVSCCSLQFLEKQVIGIQLNRNFKNGGIQYSFPIWWRSRGSFIFDRVWFLQ